MKFSLLLVLLWVIAEAGCTPTQNHEATPEPTSSKKSEQLAVPTLDTEFKRDLDRICNGGELSGAMELPVADRSMHTGIWLANNIESQEARIYSSELKQMAPQDRVASLSKMTQKHNLNRCDILASWN